MKIKYVIAVFLIMIISFFAGYSAIRYKWPLSVKENTKQEVPGVKEPSKENTQKEEEKIDPIKEQIKNMTLDEKIGQMIIVGLDGYTMDENAANMINDNHIGGFILFKNNIKNTKQMMSLMNSLKKANSTNKVPLFLSVDEEGGRISRMPGEFKNIPTNKEIGKVNNKEFSFKVGSAIGEEIRSVGFNMDFAPVLDINSNPKNPVIGDRSFGSNSKVVSDLGVETMKGLQSQSVIPVVKHFPGHGDTSIDSHIGLPSVNNSIERLESFELIPFKKAIDNNADAAMVAHILLPKIDRSNPASLSKKIISDILRDNLKFDGVVITDDMTMGAITKNFNVGEAAVKSVNAGVDIVLVCHGSDNELSAITSLKKAVESGIISQERVDESVYRILKLKKKYNISDTTVESVDIEKINKNIRQILDIYL